MARGSTNLGSFGGLLLAGLAAYIVYRSAGVLWAAGAFVAVKLLASSLINAVASPGVDKQYQAAVKRWNDSYLCLGCRETAMVADDGSGLLADPSAGEVDALLRQGRKIEAIKLVRDRTGLGLAEAKEHVEARGRELDG